MDELLLDATSTRAPPCRIPVACVTTPCEVSTHVPKSLHAAPFSCVRVDFFANRRIVKEPRAPFGSRLAAGQGVGSSRDGRTPHPEEGRQNQGIGPSSMKRTARPSGRSIVRSPVRIPVGSRLEIPAVGRDGTDARLGSEDPGWVFQENS